MINKVHTELFCISTDVLNYSLTEKHGISEMRTQKSGSIHQKDVNYTNFCQASTEAKYTILCKNTRFYYSSVTLQLYQCA